MTETPKSTARRMTTGRLLAYGALLGLLPLAYLIANTALLPGLDPYFHPRATVDAEIIERDGRKFLWGGERGHQWFDITQFRLEPDRLEYGLGREAIPAPIHPRFESMDTADGRLYDGARVLLAAIDGEVHVYPLNVMRHFEVVNDEIAGRPVFAAYCPLADLGAVYDRRFNGETYTFAVSGYTYYDWKVWGGYSTFVLWDRETESLWWPPLGKAVSGPSVDTPLRVLDHGLWAQTTWGEVKAQYDHAQVLQVHQPFEPPKQWPTKAPPRVDGDDGDGAIPPRWGRNRTLE